MEKTAEKKNYDRLIKALQIAAGVFMAAMVAAMLVVMSRFDISVENAAELSTYIKGGTLTIALIIIAFSILICNDYISPITKICNTLFGQRVNIIIFIDRYILFIFIKISICISDYIRIP
ncbi:MAG: hypothetical protein IIX36_08035 [Clostridia bacterium]|nr:hypothetical protein [Clostridia bacterium]